MDVHLRIELASGAELPVRVPHPRHGQSLVEWSRMIARQQARVTDAHALVLETESEQRAVRGHAIQSVSIVHERPPAGSWYLTCVRHRVDDPWPADAADAADAAAWSVEDPWADPSRGPAQVCREPARR